MFPLLKNFSPPYATKLIVTLLSIVWCLVTMFSMFLDIQFICALVSSFTISVELVSDTITLTCIELFVYMLLKSHIRNNLFHQIVPVINLLVEVCFNNGILYVLITAITFVACFTICWTSSVIMCMNCYTIAT